MRLAYTILLVTCLAGPPGCSDDATQAQRQTPAGDASDSADAAADTTPADTAADVEDTFARPDDAGDADDAPDTSADAAPDAGEDAGQAVTLGGPERPTLALLPDDYDPTRQYPLVVILHGYGMSGDQQDAYLGIGALRHQRQFIALAPDGTRDMSGARFWNATDYCCDHYGAAVDDAAYLLGLVDEAQQRLSVDADRVFFVGHSNGGFMSYRMACDYPERIAGVVSVAGSSFEDAAGCRATDGGPRILHVHGTNDTVVAYYGVMAYYPGARTVVERWVGRNGCEADATGQPRADYDHSVFGDETWRREWRGCQGDSRVSLWALQGSLHFPTLTDAFAPAALDFLFD